MTALMVVDYHAEIPDWFLVGLLIVIVMPLLVALWMTRR